MLTRLRQIVLHPGLIPSNYVQQLERAVQEDRENVENKPGKLIRVTSSNKPQLQAMLAQMIEDSEVSKLAHCGKLNDDIFVGMSDLFHGAHRS